MRPLAVLVALCLTPAADACFLKCFRKSGAAHPAPGGPRVDAQVRIRAVVIYQIYGRPADSDPELPPNVAGIPVLVHCDFDPTGYRCGHELNGATHTAPALQSIEVRQLWDSDLNIYYEFTYYHLPALDEKTVYKLRITVGGNTSEIRIFHTR